MLHQPSITADRLSWGTITLTVTDLARAVAFWTDALGLRVLDQNANAASLGTRDTTLFVLRAGATTPVRPPFVGMYHVAMGVPDQAEFSRMLARLMSKNIPVSPTDHLGAKSLYIADPDGLEIEITLETPARFGRFGDLTKGLVMYDVDGNPHSGRERLDLRAELAHATTANLEAPLSDGAYIAHIHFKVPTLDSAIAWFQDIGFKPNLTLPDWGFADMGAGATGTHRLGMNTWAGQNLPPAPDTMARLTGYALHIHDPAVMAAATTALTPEGDTLTTTDPTGTTITLIPAY